MYVPSIRCIGMTVNRGTLLVGGLLCCRRPLCPRQRAAMCWRPRWRSSVRVELATVAGGAVGVTRVTLPGGHLVDLSVPVPASEYRCKTVLRVVRGLKRPTGGPGLDNTWL